MANFTPEMLKKAKTARSAEELLSLAKENGIELTEEEANSCFDRLHPQSGELSDDALGNVVGGVSEKWYYTFNPKRSQPNYTVCPAPAPIDVPPIEVIGSVEHFCPHCIKVTVFNIPAQGADYCSVCNNVYDGPVTN